MAKPAARARGRKSPTKSPTRAPARQRTPAPGALVVPAHGRGAIRHGSEPGTNAGGTGRPPSIIRERLRGSFEERIAVLESIADGEPVERVDVPLAAVLAHARCPACDGALKPTADPATLALLTVEGRRSAKPRDRTGAIDLLAKYGLGTTKELSVEHVRGRLEETYRVLAAELPADVFARVDAALAEVWR